MLDNILNDFVRNLNQSAYFSFCQPPS